MYLDLRHLVHAQHLEVVEVRLLDPPFLQGDRAVPGSRQGEADAALHLRLDHIRVDGDATVHGAHHTIQTVTAIALHRDLGDLRHEGAEGFVHGNTPPALLALGTRRQRFVPASLLGGQLQRTAVTRMTFQQRA